MDRRSHRRPLVEVTTASEALALHYFGVSTERWPLPTALPPGPRADWVRAWEGPLRAQGDLADDAPSLGLVLLE